ncbi:MAG: ribokinase [Verrucomicrobiales bacterium]|nr:ribokinase [Verrucomicrobiales bacterium]
MKKSESWDVIVIGSSNTDFLVKSDTLPQPGQTLAGTEFFQGPGGKGANQAVAAARLGARVAFLTCLGCDPRGEQLLQQLKAEGVDTRFVVRDKKSFTGAAVIMVDAKGEKQILAAAGANGRLSAQNVRSALSQIAHAGVVLMQFEIPMPAVHEGARLGRKLGARVILDPAPPVHMPNDNLLALIDVIRPNSSEAEALTGIRVVDRQTARQAATELIRRGVRAVVLQAGPKGDLLVQMEHEEFFPRIPVKSVDATGAGDAFAGALAAEIARGHSFAEACQFASAAAAFATMKVGAQTALPHRREVMKLLKQAAGQSDRSR